MVERDNSNGDKAECFVDTVREDDDEVEDADEVVLPIATRLSGKREKKEYMQRRCTKTQSQRTKRIIVWFM